MIVFFFSLFFVMMTMMIMTRTYVPPWAETQGLSHCTKPQHKSVATTAEIAC